MQYNLRVWKLEPLGKCDFRLAKLAPRLEQRADYGGSAADRGNEVAAALLPENLPDQKMEGV